MLPLFTHPWALLLLCSLPPLMWVYWRRPRAAWLYADRRLLPDVVGLRAGRAERWGLALRILGLTALILAIAGPRWPDPASRIPTEGIALALVLDVSGSMAEQDFLLDGAKVRRLDAVKKIVHGFVTGGATPAGDLAGRPDDLLALVTFATRPETACPLTLEHRTLLDILDAEEPRTASTEATTNPGDALAWALRALDKAPTRRKAIVFLTDGESNVPEGLSPRQAAQLAGNLHIPIYAIDAAPEPAETDGSTGLVEARAALEAVAKLTGGAYFRAADGTALAHAYAAIDRLERDVLLSADRRRYYEGFAVFAVAALACWSALLALEATSWRQVP